MRAEHERDLRDLLQRVRGRWMTVTFGAGLARATATVALVGLAAVVIERLWRPAPLGLMLLGAVTATAGLLVIVWGARSIGRSPPAAEVARFVEERCPELEDRLASAMHVTERSARGLFQDLIVADAAERARSLDLDRIVRRNRVGQVLAAAALGVAAVVVTAILAADSAVRVGRAAVLFGFPASIDLEVTPGDARVPAGDPFQITARVHTPFGLPDGVRPNVVIGRETGHRSRPMTFSADGFVLDLPRVTTGFTYHVAVGTLTSPAYHVTAVFPASVTRIDLAYDYPASSGMDDRVDETGGDIYAPRGTRVGLRIHVDKPVRSGALVMGGGRQVALDPAGDRVLESALRISENGSYRVALVDEHGLVTPGGTEYFIRVLDDRPPTVRIIRPASDRQVTPLEEVTIETRADDDYGVERVDLVYSVRGSRERVVRLTDGRPETSVTAAHALLLEDLNVRPGDFVTYYARARDVGRGKPSSEARSDIFFLEVTEFDGEFARARTMAGMTGRDDDVSHLAAVQKEIIVATWKLDRRSVAGGRSDADVKVVARAQGELKERAVRAAGYPMGLLGTPWVGHGLSRGPSAPEDPMVVAVAAMGRAEAVLNGLNTTDALPFEMEALTQLLQVELAAGRREVAGQGGRGGGSNRDRRDLSALFDEELQRQQQTNYETRPSADERDEEKESEALTRVRELARRQDALGEAHRQLARRKESLSPEDRRRQLEQLVREQRELRRDTEALARRLAAMREGDAGAARDTGGEPLWDATEEMRGATNDLLRENVTDAMAHSARAAGRLRDLERDLRAMLPFERARALGEMQLEARQLAEAERRMANEARHLAPGEAGADLGRRLAGQRERVADRIDRLEENVRALSASAEPAERQPLDEAVRELRDREMAERLRDVAAALRAQTAGESVRPDAESSSGSAGPELTTIDPDRLAEADAAMAMSLDRVAEHIGTAAGMDLGAASLLEGLERVREARERLADAERRLEAASAEVQQGREVGEYVRELERAAALLKELGGENQALDRALEAIAGAGQVRSAPGTEVFKQDFAAWEILKREVELALERYEASRTRELADRGPPDRLNSGGSNEVPSEYQKLVEEYYRLLAAKKKP